jgi:uncharacterized membrane protein
MSQPKLSDQEIEERMGGLLRWGVTIASLMMLLGAILYLTSNGSEPADYIHFRPAAPIQWTLHGNAVVRIGIFLLIGTPVARVGFAAYAFHRQHDKLYFWISLAVLALLFLGLFGRL